MAHAENRGSLNYVAIGSSYAAGPDPADMRAPCLRSDDNYPHIVAVARNMRLTDVTCTGATTANVISRPQKAWTSALQIAAIRPDTDLVTITVGGNDLDYVGRVTAMSCANASGRTAAATPPPPPYEASKPTVTNATQVSVAKRMCRSGHPVRPEPTAAAYATLEQNLVRIAVDAKIRAPRAQIVFVDYPPAVIEGVRPCSKLLLTPDQIAETKRIYDGLVDATANAARASGSTLVQASRAGLGHTVCSSQPWLTGFEPPLPYHPTDAGKQAVARLVLNAIS